jgi:hypothetical protein
LSIGQRTLSAMNMLHMLEAEEKERRWGEAEIERVSEIGYATNCTTDF